MLKNKTYPAKFAWFVTDLFPGAKNGRKFGMKSSIVVINVE